MKGDLGRGYRFGRIRPGRDCDVLDVAVLALGRTELGCMYVVVFLNGKAVFLVAVVAVAGVRFVIDVGFRWRRQWRYVGFGAAVPCAASPVVFVFLAAVAVGRGARMVTILSAVVLTTARQTLSLPHPARYIARVGRCVRMVVEVNSYNVAGRRPLFHALYTATGLTSRNIVNVCGRFSHCQLQLALFSSRDLGARVGDQLEVIQDQLTLYPSFVLKLR